MTQTYTIRPREKIISRSASALSDHELLQALIGTGTRHMNVARIARLTLKALRKNNGSLHFKELCDIPGLGPAYAARILAAFELAKRWNYLRRPAAPGVSLLAELQQQMAKEHSLLMYDLYDGSHGFLKRQVIALHDAIDQVTVIRQMTTEILAAQANSVQVGVCGDRLKRLLYMSDIVYCRSLAQLLKSIGVTLQQFIVVTRTDIKELL